MPTRISRRLVLGSALAGFAGAAAAQGRIDRRALVRRHNPVLRGIDPLAPLSVGNGQFAFTADITGLQTFTAAYEPGIPLCTQSHWGWHSVPRLAGELQLKEYDTYGRKVGYATSAAGQRELYNWLRENPHRLNLARIAFDTANPEDLSDIEQTLDLWTGTISSRFRVRGAAVAVRTACHAEIDAIAVEIESSAAPGIVFAFPYGSPDITASDWKREDAHTTSIARRTADSIELERKLDDAAYRVTIAWQGDASLVREGAHRFVLRGGGTGVTHAPRGLKPAPHRLSFTCRFSPQRDAAAPAADVSQASFVFAASERHWARFWGTGGAVEFAGTRDARAAELERRVVLSQYLTAIQCAGTLPPQETGLTCNSWYGKFHLEMHWWHAVHFAYWGRFSLLDRSLDWYNATLPAAAALARQQGYRGARWPKMVGPEGRDSPSPIGPLLIWQQPHPLYYAELAYRERPRRETLDRFRDVVFQTADFMASFAQWDGTRFVLGPPLIPAQENHPPEQTWNPTYEIEYWRWGLGVAQRWRERLGLSPNPEWDRVRANLPALPVKDGLYLAHENCPNTFTKKNVDHPSMLAALGVLPGDGVDRETMRRTLRTVMKSWQWPETWGWDFPMTAMTAARLGERETAIGALFIESPKNRYLPNGHNWQRKGLPLYLPGNGALLTAVAMMASGWEGSRDRNGPGFPPNWKVRWEGLKPML